MESSSLLSPLAPSNAKNLFWEEGWDSPGAVCGWGDDSGSDDMGQASGVFSVVDEQLLAERATESCEDSNMSNVVWAMEKVSVAAVIIQAAWRKSREKKSKLYQVLTDLDLQRSDWCWDGPRGEAVWRPCGGRMDAFSTFECMDWRDRSEGLWQAYKFLKSCRWWVPGHMEEDAVKELLKREAGWKGAVGSLSGGFGAFLGMDWGSDPSKGGIFSRAAGGMKPTRISNKPCPSLHTELPLGGDAPKTQWKTSQNRPTPQTRPHPQGTCQTQLPLADICHAAKQVQRPPEKSSSRNGPGIGSTASEETSEKQQNRVAISGKLPATLSAAKKSQPAGPQLQHRWPLHEHDGMRDQGGVDVAHGAPSRSETDIQKSMDSRHNISHEQASSQSHDKSFQQCQIGSSDDPLTVHLNIGGKAARQVASLMEQGNEERIQAAMFRSSRDNDARNSRGSPDDKVTGSSRFSHSSSPTSFETSRPTVRNARKTPGSLSSRDSTIGQDLPLERKSPLGQGSDESTFQQKKGEFRGGSASEKSAVHKARPAQHNHFDSSAGPPALANDLAVGSGRPSEAAGQAGGGLPRFRHQPPCRPALLLRQQSSQNWSKGVQKGCFGGDAPAGLKNFVLSGRRDEPLSVVPAYEDTKPPSSSLAAAPGSFRVPDTASKRPIAIAGHEMSLRLDDGPSEGLRAARHSADSPVSLPRAGQQPTLFSEASGQQRPAQGSELQRPLSHCPPHEQHSRRKSSSSVTVRRSVTSGSLNSRVLNKMQQPPPDANFRQADSHGLSREARDMFPPGKLRHSSTQAVKDLRTLLRCRSIVDELWGMRP